MSRPPPEKVLPFPVGFEWDEDKAIENARKHGVSFTEAVTVFADPLAFTAPDVKHSERFYILGLSSQAHLLFVVYAEVDENGETTRLISARPANRREREAYEEGDA
jgi:uncharacterized DUF497 family protein